MTLNKPRSSFQERDSHSGQPYNVRPLTGLIIGYRHAPLSSGAKAAWLDSHLWKILEAATGLCIPRTTTDAVWNCLLPVPVEGKESISFQGWVVSPPVRLGGFGFRSHQDTAKFAFIGALEQAILAFQGERGVCPQLAHQMGGDDCFGEGAGGSRWRVMFSSGSREGEDLRRAWNSLQGEERQAAHWLEVGMQDNLSGGVEEVGELSCDGSTGGNCQRSETSPELELSKRDLRCILARIEQTDQFRLGSKVTSCQLLGCKLYLVQTQASQVTSSQEQQPSSFVFHLQPAVTDLAR